MKVERGQQTPRGLLPTRPWTRPARLPTDLEPFGVYLVFPDEEMVYATHLTDYWYFVGEERTFSVADDGVVTEITEDADAQRPMTLTDFHPTFRYMSWCSEHQTLMDWTHAKICDEL